MRKVLLFFCIIISINAVAQFKEYPYKLSTQVDEKVAKDTVPWKYQLAAIDYSFIGAYQKALSAADSQYNFIKKAARLSPEDSIYVFSFTPAPARDYLLRQATQEQLIIINEAHYQPQHRAFVTSLLEGLYQKGFRYLGIEALSYTDSLLNQRKYPILETGYYSREPQFGNMIREALRLGFTLFAYETKDPSRNNAARETDQARNIEAFIKQHPDGKFLVYCGHDHVIEGPHRSWGKAMAGRLKEYTGIDPLTINQDVLTEHSAPLYEKADYSAIHFPETAILINKEDKTYNGYKNDSLYDIRLYHPRTQYKNGRPGWMLQQYEKPYTIPAKKIKLAYPVLVMAFVAGEDINIAIPYDVMELSGPEDKKVLILQKGSYTVLLKNETGASQTIPVAIE